PHTERYVDSSVSAALTTQSRIKVDSIVAYFWTPAKPGGFHLRRPPVSPSEGHAVGPDDRPEGGRERGDDQTADRRYRPGRLLPRPARCCRLDAEERDP